MPSNGAPSGAHRERAVVRRVGQPAGPGGLIAGDLPVVLLPVFQTDGQGLEDAVVVGAPHIEVERELIELDAAAVARQWTGIGDDIRHAGCWIPVQVVGADGCVDGVGDRKTELVVAVSSTQVNVPAGHRATPAKSHRQILDARSLVGEEAIRIHRVGIAFVEVDEVGHHEVPGGIAGFEALPIVVCEPVGAARLSFAARCAAERVEFSRIAGGHTGIEEKRPAIVRRRTGGDEFILEIRVQPAVAAIALQGGHVVPLAGDIQKTAGAQRNPAVERRGDAFPIAAAETPMQRQLAAVGPFLENEIDDPGNGVRAVLRGCSVAQHLQAWRRLPFISTRVWSGPRPRKVAGVSSAPSPTDRRV